MFAKIRRKFSVNIESFKTNEKETLQNWIIDTTERNFFAFFYALFVKEWEVQKCETCFIYSVASWGEDNVSQKIFFNVYLDTIKH